MISRTRFALLPLLVLCAGPALAQTGPALAGRVAGAQNAATVNQNPAGIMRLPDFEVVVDSTLALSPNKFDVNEAESTESGGNPDNDPSIAAIPQLAVSVPAGDYLAFGLGFSIPTGFGSDYGDDWAGRYLAQESSLVFLSLQPVVAARVTDWLSLGAGAAIMYTASETKVAVNNGPGQDDGRMKLELDGVSAGPVLSFLIEPSPTFRFGAIWRGEIEPKLKGTPKFRDLSPALEGILDGLGLLNEKIDLKMRSPQIVQAGFYWQTTPDVAVMGDFTWVDWSRFGTIDISVGDVSTTVNSNYDDIYIGSIGAEYRFSERFTGGLGFTYVSSGVKDSNRTLAFPIDEYYISGIGLTTRWSERLEIQTNFLGVVGGDGPIDQGSGRTGRLVGDYKRRLSFALQSTFIWRPLK
jgi:long-chain fatty acid transport protein